MLVHVQVAPSRLHDYRENNVSQRFGDFTQRAQIELMLMTTHRQPGADIFCVPVKPDNLLRHPTVVLYCGSLQKIGGDFSSNFLRHLGKLSCLSVHHHPCTAPGNKECALTPYCSIGLLNYHSTTNGCICASSRFRSFQALESTHLVARARICPVL